MADWGDAGYRGGGKRPNALDSVRWNIALRPGKRKLLDNARLAKELTDWLERLRASIRAKVEPPFRVIKRQFGHVKVRYCGLAENTAQLYTLFSLSNLWMVQRTLMRAQTWVRLQWAKWSAGGSKAPENWSQRGPICRIDAIGWHQHIGKRLSRASLGLLVEDAFCMCPGSAKDIRLNTVSFGSGIFAYKEVNKDTQYGVRQCSTKRQT